MSGSPPSRARDVVLVFAATLAIITYIDRVCISKSADLMMTDLSLTRSRWLRVLGVWLAYALFEIPAGWLATRSARASCSCAW